MKTGWKDKFGNEIFIGDTVHYKNGRDDYELAVVKNESLLNGFHFEWDRRQFFVPKIFEQFLELLF